MELSERKLKVLQAIISDYVRTAEPVGSRTLSKKPELDYSPATSTKRNGRPRRDGLPDTPAHIGGQSSFR